MSTVRLNILWSYVNKIQSMIEIKKYISTFVELAKFRITFFVAISTSIGFILASDSLNINILYSTMGIFLLACGSSALNHFQEKELDAVMDRTKNRPLPLGIISKNAAIYFILFTTLSGSFLLFYFIGIEALLLGLTALIWYNVIYTPLKRINALAVVPGALIGSLPPMVGWVAGGGNIIDPQNIALALFFFIWQIPHFWLLLLIYSKDYEKAGYPTLTKIFNPQQLSRISYIWIISLGVSSLLIPLFDDIKSLFIMMILFIASFWVIFSTRKILTQYLERLVLRKAFMKINIFVLFVVLVLSIEKLFIS